MSSPTNQHPVFYRPDALPVAQPTVSKHCYQRITSKNTVNVNELGTCVLPVSDYVSYSEVDVREPSLSVRNRHIDTRLSILIEICDVCILQESKRHALSSWRSSWTHQTAWAFAYSPRTTAVSHCGKRRSCTHSSTLKTLHISKNSALSALRMWNHCWKAMKSRQAEFNSFLYLFQYSLCDVFIVAVAIEITDCHAVTGCNTDPWLNRPSLISVSVVALRENCYTHFTSWTNFIISNNEFMILPRLYVGHYGHMLMRLYIFGTRKKWFTFVTKLSLVNCCCCL